MHLWGVISGVHSATKEELEAETEAQVELVQSVCVLLVRLRGWFAGLASSRAAVSEEAGWGNTI